MTRPALYAPRYAWAEFAAQAGVDVEGLTKNQIIEAIPDEPAEHPTVEAAPAEPAPRPAKRFEVFSGPAFDFTVSREPDPSTVVVHDTSLRRQVDVTVEGSTIRRTQGHFGRGGNRWHVSYRPNR